MDKLCYIFLYFVFYSIIGYVCEVFYVYLGDKKWVNRGFLHGPYIPIYGNGAMIVSLALMHVKKDSFIIFLVGLVLCSLLEYITSYVMEKIFHNRWWDYSERKYNLNAGTLNIKRGKIKGTTGYGIMSEAETINIGEDDETLSTTEPEIKGNTYGLYIQSGDVNFYVYLWIISCY